MERREEENGKLEETQPSTDSSICGFQSLHHLLKASLQPHLYQAIFFLLVLKLFIYFFFSFQFWDVPFCELGFFLCSSLITAWRAIWDFYFFLGCVYVHGSGNQFLIRIFVALLTCEFGISLDSSTTVLVNTWFFSLRWIPVLCNQPQPWLWFWFIDCCRCVCVCVFFLWWSIWLLRKLSAGKQSRFGILCLLFY